MIAPPSLRHPLDDFHELSPHLEEEFSLLPQKQTMLNFLSWKNLTIKDRFLFEIFNHGVFLSADLPKK